MELLQANKKQIIVTALVVAASLAGHFLFAHPKIEASKRNREQIRTLDEAIQRSSLAMGEMTQLFSSASDLENVSVQSDEEILPALLASIAAQGENHGVEIVSMKPTAIERVELEGGALQEFQAESTRLVVSVTVEAGYHALGKYLESLESIPVLVAVRNLRITRKEGAVVLVSASFDIETYSIRTDHAQAQ
jgi:Tfp pilus assembly protein PilO